MSHDLGTSGNKATLFDTAGRLVAGVVHPYETLYPDRGWVEQRPEEWWAAVCVTTRHLLEKAGAQPSEVLCVCFSGQMMGCLLVDGKGRPLRNMITWADSRAQRQEAWMLAQVGMERGYRITGHRLSASYSAAKLLWVRDQEPELYRKAAKLLQAKDYVIYRMTGALVTDYSDASGSNLLDIESKSWSDELLQAFSLRRDLLPDLHSSTDVAGVVTGQSARECGLLAGTPVVIGGGDGSCACVGAGAVEPGKAYNAIGTSSWISGAANAPRFDPEMRTFNWVHLDPTLYAPCGTMQAAGLSYQWYRNTMGRQEMEQARREGLDPYHLLNMTAAAAPPGAGGVLYLPYLVGERSPHWNLDARGAFVGLHATTRKNHLARAILEGVGFNLRIILESLFGSQLPESITAVGGGAKGKTWLQILSDIWQLPIEIPAYIEEAASLGAAICGGVGIGVYNGFRECAHMNPLKERVHPCQDHQLVYDRMFQIFQQTYQGLLPTYAALARDRTVDGW